MPALFQRLFVVFMIGGLGLAACDLIHVHYDVLFYLRPFVWGQAWWVAPQFGLAAVMIFLVAALLTPPSPRPGRVGPAAAWLVVAYFASAWFQGYPHMLLVAYLVLWFFRVELDPQPWWLAAFCVGLACLGVAYEAFLSGTGVFFYTQPDLFGVPIWLFGLYLHGAPLALHWVRRSRRPG